MQSTHFWQFTRQVFDMPALAHQAAEIIKAILEARSPRLADIARKMPGSYASAYKRLQRFLQTTDPRAPLLRLFQSEATFVLGDPTDMPRLQAYKTAYVGQLKDKRRGFWLLMLATPFHGRALPFHFVTYSSRLLALRAESRNQNHLRAFTGVKHLLGERPWVLDREFSYEWLLADLVAEGVHFIIRLNLGSHPPIFLDARNKRVELTVAQGENVSIPNVRYRGEVPVNLCGIWKVGLQEPLWIMTDLAPEAGLQIYFARMKIDETFRDLKNLLQVDHRMNQQQEQMEKVVALILLAFAIGSLVGEELRDALYGAAVASPAPARTTPAASQRTQPARPKRDCFSGLFILLKFDHPLPLARLQAVVKRAQANFVALIRGSVRTHVRTHVRTSDLDLHFSPPTCYNPAALGKFQTCPTLSPREAPFMSNTSDLLIWESRWLALDNLMASIASQSVVGVGSTLAQDFPRKQTLISLAQRLRNFARGHYNFFADHLGNPADTLLTTSPDYPPEAIFTAIFKQIGNDIQAISSAITQRSMGNDSMAETLQRADQLAHAAIKPVLPTWLKRPTNSEPQTVLTYFHRSAAVSVIPYAPVALIAIPYTCMVAPQDFLAIPHEIGHYVFWHGQQASEGSLRQLMRDQAIQLRPAWIAKWVEEIFADVYGALIAGEAIAQTSQDVQSAYAGVKFVQDDGRFPVPAIRPYIYTKTLELMGQFDQAEALEHRWYVRRSGRHVKLSTTTQLEYAQASVPTMGEARSEMAKIVDDVVQLLGKLPSDWPQTLTTTPADQLPALFKRLAPPPELNPRADISNLYDHWRETDPITDGPAPDEQGPIPIERWLRLVYANGWTMLS